LMFARVSCAMRPKIDCFAMVRPFERWCRGVVLVVLVVLLVRAGRGGAGWGERT